MGYKRVIRKIAKFILTSQPESTVNVKIAQINYGNILNNKKIVITGGNKGIGYYMAKKCISEGAEVIICGRDKETLENVSKELGNRCHSLVFDITNIKEDNKFLDNCSKIFKGSIDCLVNNAGLSLHENSFQNVTEETFDKQFDINLKASYFLSKAFLETKLKENKPNGHLLIISSESAEQCYDIPYGMTKASLNTLTRALSRRVYKSGIRVNAISPGVVSTNMTKDYADVSDGNMYRDCASGRIFLPEEVAEVACFILSDASKCISGEIIHCNAGNHLKAFWDKCD